MKKFEAGAKSLGRPYPSWFSRHLRECLGIVPHTQSHQVLAQPGVTVTADEGVDIALEVFDERSRGIHPFDDGIGRSEKSWE